MAYCTHKKPVGESQLREWGAKLNDPLRKLTSRSHALWGLRHASEPLAAQLIMQFVRDHKANSDKANDLLQHEAAYCLGQRNCAESSRVCSGGLIEVVRDPSHATIVRHEAAEALASMAPVCDRKTRNEIRKVLQDHHLDPHTELAETCQLGLARLDWLEHPDNNRPPDKDKCGEELPFELNAPPLDTIDPAPAYASDLYKPSELLNRMLNQNRPLWERYRALFTLRDRAMNPCLTNDEREEAARMVGQGLCAQGSALLRHEVAFVMGQIAHTATAEMLIACVNRPIHNEHSMVRHEAAEALGSVLGAINLAICRASDCSKSTVRMLRESSSRAEACLRAHLKDEQKLIRDSCKLALDAADYESSLHRPEYAYTPSEAMCQKI